MTHIKPYTFHKYVFYENIQILIFSLKEEESYIILFQLPPQHDKYRSRTKVTNDTKGDAGLSIHNE